MCIDLPQTLFTFPKMAYSRPPEKYEQMELIHYVKTVKSKAVTSQGRATVYLLMDGGGDD